jgi:protein arginine N-methyltransferase 1
MYGVYDFGLMLADRVRMEAYLRALRQAVTPGCTVLEIGTGTGLFAMLARRWGAGRVFAVEVSDTIELAPQIAEANELAEGIEFIKGFSTQLDLPVKADVLISDLRGTLPLYRMHLPSIIDARERLLAPGGVQIPTQDRIRGVVVETPSMFQRLQGPWETGHFDIDHSVVSEIAANTWRRWRQAEMGDARSLTSPAEWVTVDYTRVLGPHCSGDLRWTIEQAGTAHGLNLWFDATLLQGIEYSTAPDAPELVYGNAFFPLLQPVDVREGDEIRCSLRADLIGGRYIWTWRTVIRSTGVQPIEYTQSTFYSTPLGRKAVAAQESNHAPRLATEGRLLKAALQLMDGSRTLDVIAAELERAFPSRFNEWDSAIAWVRQLSLEYSD